MGVQARPQNQPANRPFEKLITVQFAHGKPQLARPRRILRPAGLRISPADRESRKLEDSPGLKKGRMFEILDARRLTEEIKDAGTHFLHASLVAPARAIHSGIDKITPGTLPAMNIETPEASSTGARAGEMLGTAVLLTGAFLAARGAGHRIGTFMETRAASRFSGTMSLKHGLALDTGLTAGSESISISALAARPLPRFEHLQKPLSGMAKLEGAALKQSQDYVNTGLISGRLEDGVHLATLTNSRGFKTGGIPASIEEKFVVVDRTKDPVLKAVLDDAAQRYAGMKPGPEMASDLSSYVGRLFNRHNLSGETLGSVYEDMLRRSSGNAIPIGFFLQRGNGVCLQRSALYKAIADDVGLNVRLREGFMGIKNPQPHVWTEVNFGTKYHIYDTSHAPNPLFRYISTKH